MKFEIFLRNLIKYYLLTCSKFSKNQVYRLIKLLINFYHRNEINRIWNNFYLIKSLLAIP